MSFPFADSPTLGVNSDKTIFLCSLLSVYSVGMLGILFPVLNKEPVWCQEGSSRSNLWPVEALLLSLLVENDDRNDVALVLKVAFTLRLPSGVSDAELRKNSTGEMVYRVSSLALEHQDISLKFESSSPVYWLDMLVPPWRYRDMSYVTLSGSSDILVHWFHQWLRRLTQPVASELTELSHALRLIPSPRPMLLVAATVLRAGVTRGIKLHWKSLLKLTVDQAVQLCNAFSCTPSLQSALADFAAGEPTDLLKALRICEILHVEVTEEERENIIMKSFRHYGKDAVLSALKSGCMDHALPNATRWVPLFTSILRPSSVELQLFKAAGANFDGATTAYIPHLSTISYWNVETACEVLEFFLLHDRQASKRGTVVDACEALLRSPDFRFHAKEDSKLRAVQSLLQLYQRYTDDVSTAKSKKSEKTLLSVLLEASSAERHYVVFDKDRGPSHGDSCLPTSHFAYIEAVAPGDPALPDAVFTAMDKGLHDVVDYFIERGFVSLTDTVHPETKEHITDYCIRHCSNWGVLQAMKKHGAFDLAGKDPFIARKSWFKAALGAKQRCPVAREGEPDTIDGGNRLVIVFLLQEVRIPQPFRPWLNDEQPCLRSMLTAEWLYSSFLAIVWCLGEHYAEDASTRREMQLLLKHVIDEASFSTRELIIPLVEVVHRFQLVDVSKPLEHDAEGRTLLMLAVAAGREALVYHLVRKMNVDLSVSNRQGQAAKDVDEAGLINAVERKQIITRSKAAEDLKPIAKTSAPPKHAHLLDDD